jgi:hypothetical protein
MTDRKAWMQTAKIDAPAPDLDGAMLLHRLCRRHDLRHLGTTDIHLRYLDQVIGSAPAARLTPA